MKDDTTPGSELLQTMAGKLDPEIPEIKDWHHLAYNLDVRVGMLQAFSGLGQSPTKKLMQLLVSRLPGMTLKDLVKELEKINRNDAIQIITRQFSDTVGESKILSVITLYLLFSITLV